MYYFDNDMLKIFPDLKDNLSIIKQNNIWKGFYEIYEQLISNEIIDTIVLRINLKSKSMEL